MPMAIRADVRHIAMTAQNQPGVHYMHYRYVSRDRNIVQFYGACVQSNELLLIAELMEVCAHMLGRRQLNCTRSNLFMLFLCHATRRCSQFLNRYRIVMLRG